MVTQHTEKVHIPSNWLRTAEEVWEVAQELDFYDSVFTVKFLEKAFDAGVRFTPEQVLEMEGTVERSFLSRLAEQSDGVFSLDELEDIDGLIDDNSFRKISRQAGIRALDREDESWPEQKVYSTPPKKPGLLAALMALVTGVSLASHSEKKHSRHCDSDCANCPPHYGYRYGRWYYGKGHQYGCEFGGNKGNGD